MIEKTLNHTFSNYFSVQKNDELVRYHQHYCEITGYRWESSNAQYYCNNKTQRSSDLHNEPCS